MSGAFREVERMFRSYHAWKFKAASLRLRVGPRSASLINVRREPGPQENPQEALLAELSDLELRIKQVRLCLRAMTRDERRFVELRYFSGFPMKVVEREMAWSRSHLYRLRASVLAKSAWILGLRQQPPATR